MQPKMRQEFDADRTEGALAMSRVKTEQNQHEMQCGICFGTFFVDNVTNENVIRGIELGRDNPFVCDDCRAAYEEAADQAR